MKSSTSSARNAITVGRNRSTYVERLDRLWSDHKAKKPDDAPTVVSLFAGCGGSSLGYSAAGYQERLAVEWDTHAAEVFNANFHVPLYTGDICELSDNEALEIAGLNPGELDVLDGSPPCQGFSTAGSKPFGYEGRKIDDKRNRLFEEHVRLLKAFQPRAMIMENVSGIVKGKMRIIFDEIIRALKGVGYDISCRIVDASWLGVPQARQRTIFIGIRKDIGIGPSYPVSRHPRITAGQAIVDADLGEKVEIRGQSVDLWKAMRPGQNGSDVLRKGTRFGMIKVDPNRPSNTVLKTVIDTPNGCAGLCHWNEPRMLTIPEIKRLCSFPDQFEIPGKFAKQWAVLGNAVPPLMMYEIATHLRGLLNKH